MEQYQQVISEAELALNRGEYSDCVNKLNPLLDKLAISSSDGINIRMILITAFSGMNKNKEAVVICKQLIKSKYSHVREEAKYLLEVLNSPDLKIPESWNINFENNLTYDKFKSDVKLKNETNLKEKYIDISNEPTGETKPFQKGFIFSTIFLFFLIMSLLSGCVRVDNTIDLTDIDAINYNLKIESQYINKIPWQLNFEKKLSDEFPKNSLFFNQGNLLLKEKGINLSETNILINKIIKIVSETSQINLNSPEIEKKEQNYLIFKKYFFNIKIDLEELENISNPEINIKIISPSKIKLPEENDNVDNINNKEIVWRLFAGKTNQIKFSYWNWNKLVVVFLIVIFLIIFAYYLRNKRYQLGSNLPQLPS